MLSTPISLACLSLMSLITATPTSHAHRNANLHNNVTRVHNEKITINLNLKGGNHVASSVNGTDKGTNNTQLQQSLLQDHQMADAIAKQIAVLQAQDKVILSKPLTSKSSAALKKNLDKIASLKAQRRNDLYHADATNRTLLAFGRHRSNDHTVSTTNGTSKGRLFKGHLVKLQGSKPKRSEKVHLKEQNSNA